MKYILKLFKYVCGNKTDSTWPIMTRGKDVFKYYRNKVQIYIYELDMYEAAKVRMLLNHLVRTSEITYFTIYQFS